MPYLSKQELEGFLTDLNNPPSYFDCKEGFRSTKLHRLYQVARLLNIQGLEQSRQKFLFTEEINWKKNTAHFGL